MVIGHGLATSDNRLFVDFAVRPVQLSGAGRHCATFIFNLKTIGAAAGTHLNPLYLDLSHIFRAITAELFFVSFFWFESTSTVYT